MPVFTQVATLTKAQLVSLLEGVSDDAKVYVMAADAVVKLALAGANGEPHDAYFGLSSNMRRELNGVSLVADLRPA